MSASQTDLASSIESRSEEEGIYFLVQIPVLLLWMSQASEDNVVRMMIRRANAKLR